MSKLDNIDSEFLESRKVEALEKIADSLEDLVVWVEDIDKEEWGDRLQYYLAEFHKLIPQSEQVKNEVQ